jgi:hypothetical protein
VDNTERYLTKVVERRASANTECRIDFEVGRADVKPELGENAAGISMIKQNLASLIENTEFDLDSIVVSAAASPDGTYAANASLAQKRSISVSKYFEKYIKEYTDSVKLAAGFTLDLEGDGEMKSAFQAQNIVLTPRSIPENWDDLKLFLAHTTTSIPL